MNTSNSHPSDSREHHLEWNDRLQDWLDGALDAADAAALQAHMADCALCRARAEELQRLDMSLRRAAPRMALDDAFDAKIFAQLDVFDEARRAEARRRLEQELQQNLRALARGWRRALLFIVPGVVAGVALALVLGWWLADTSIMRMLIVQGAAELGSDNSGQVRLIAMSLLGAGLGALIARWMASVVE